MYLNPLNSIVRKYHFNTVRFRYTDPPAPPPHNPSSYTRTFAETLRDFGIDILYILSFSTSRYYPTIFYNSTSKSNLFMMQICALDSLVMGLYSNVEYRCFSTNHGDPPSPLATCVPHMVFNNLYSLHKSCTPINHIIYIS
jgi:hypothetical protein